ncbi:MAG: hypothetical protein A2138_09770 [Deltaproteobacteria bacterium RBG_16_71_12]|nr:MAG: hypothetical protein A2138_09770 [Deltaproteobacteria bacterium RBG_16_71_12]
MNVCFLPGRALIACCLPTMALAVGACEHRLDGQGPDTGALPDEQSVALECSSSSARCPTPPVACADLAELASWRWSARADDLAQSTRTLVTTRIDVVKGLRALRLTTASGSLAWLRYTAPSLRPIDARGAAALELMVRGSNANTPTWQGNAPVVALVDTQGRRRMLVPERGLLSSDGAAWTRVSVPLSGGPSARGGVRWSSAGVVDLGSLATIEIGADTWGAGFSLDVDGVAFTTATGAVLGCAVDCPARCSGQGRCDEDSVQCSCDVGSTGAGCERCLDGFALEQGRCQLPNDASYPVWPNDRSRANSDAWLAVHHDEIERLEPRVLVLNFVNPSNPAAVDALVEDVRTAFEEARRPPATASRTARCFRDAPTKTAAFAPRTTARSSRRRLPATTATSTPRPTCRPTCARSSTSARCTRCGRWCRARSPTRASPRRSR